MVPTRVFMQVAVVCLSVAVLGAAAAGTRWTEQVVFSPGMQFLQGAHEACDADPPNLQKCFAEQMQKYGAKPEAVEFAKTLGEPGFARDFKTLGPVDIAYVMYAYRANENQAILLVNGEPSPNDVDNQKLLPLEDAHGNAAYAALAKEYPQISFWPGDRSGTDHPYAMKSASGAQDFIVGYTLRNQCHACAVVGHEWFAFRFQPDGKFEKAELVGATASEETSVEVKGDAQTVRATAGQEVTLLLEANPSTGYSWDLAEAPGGWKVQMIDHEYVAPKEGVPGQGGHEAWRMGAIAVGTAELKFVYRRPWEKDKAPAKTVTVKMEVGGAAGAPRKKHS